MERIAIRSTAVVESYFFVNFNQPWIFSRFSPSASRQSISNVSADTLRSRSSYFV